MAAVANLERGRLVGDREMAITRIFDAPRDRCLRGVDRSGSDRPVGVWKFTMHGPHGTNYPNEIR